VPDPDPVQFTPVDKALLERAARHLTERADNLERSNTPWGSTSEGRDAKRLHDRLRRDERDLRVLARRLASSVHP